MNSKLASLQISEYYNVESNQINSIYYKRPTKLKVIPKNDLKVDENDCY